MVDFLYFKLIDFPILMCRLLCGDRDFLADSSVFFFYSDEELEFLSFKGEKGVGGDDAEYLVQKRRLEPASINFWRTPARICPVPFAETSERGQRDSRRKKRLKSSFKGKWRGNYRL